MCDSDDKTLSSPENDAVDYLEAAEKSDVFLTASDELVTPFDPLLPGDSADADTQADPYQPAVSARSVVSSGSVDIPWRGLPVVAVSDPPVAGVLLGVHELPRQNCQASSEASTGDDKAEDKAELVLGVKFSQYGAIYFFKAGQEKIKIGSKVLVDTDQGVFLAEVAIARRLLLPLPKIRTEEGYEVEIKSIRGLAMPEDIAAAADNRILAASARLYCKECIRSRNLDMNLVDVEVLHDRSKIIFYFTAPTRIDFRELVKDLVRNYHTRIELRQIGVRHETQMLGALGNCGMTCCCRRYLRKFAPVTIKMAKEQNLFLNVTKLSGICGRLLCCLSYEQENYDEFHKRCPKIGKKFITDRGTVKIMRANLFRQCIVIQDEAGQESELQLDEWEGLHPVRLEIPGQDELGGKPRGLREARSGYPENRQNSFPAEPEASGEQARSKSSDAAAMEILPSAAAPAQSGSEPRNGQPEPAGAFTALQEEDPVAPAEDILDASPEAFVEAQAREAEDKSVFGLPGSRYAEASARRNTKNKSFKQHRHRR
ncbi:MAG: hypothetical protein LBM00_11295 [Deltaproteobacteria bacterium]|nr:hypothetical protein [Deltaproteobacteria bacterium]